MLFGLFWQDLIFMLIPLIIIAFFAIALVRYIHGKRLRKKAPDLITHRQLRNRLIMLVVASVLLGLLACIVIGFIILLYTAVAFM